MNASYNQHSDNKCTYNQILQRQIFGNIPRVNTSSSSSSIYSQHASDIYIIYTIDTKVYTPTLLCARITHFQPCTITQSSERISGQIRVFARILSFCPHTAFRPSPGFATYDQWVSGVFNQRIASDYYIVTSYLNAFNLLNYNDICLYKQYAILCQQNVSAIRWSY